jgi:Niemann-Pick C1 protein
MTCLDAFLKSSQGRS